MTEYIDFKLTAAFNAADRRAVLACPASSAGVGLEDLGKTPK